MAISEMAQYVKHIWFDEMARPEIMMESYRCALCNKLCGIKRNGKGEISVCNCLNQSSYEDASWRSSESSF